MSPSCRNLCICYDAKDELVRHARRRGIRFLAPNTPAAVALPCSLPHLPAGPQADLKWEERTGLVLGIAEVRDGGGSPKPSA